MEGPVIRDDDPIVKQITKLDPKQGDVIVLQIDKHYPMSQLWDRLEDFKTKAGIEILVHTDEMLFYPISETGDYALVYDTPLSEEHKERIIADWVRMFPKAKLALLPGKAENLVETGDYWPSKPEPTDGVDIL